MKKKTKTRNSFPFRDMKKGDKFFIAATASPTKHVRCYAYAATQRIKGHKFSTSAVTKRGIPGTLITRTK